MMSQEGLSLREIRRDVRRMASLLHGRVPVLYDELLRAKKPNGKLPELPALNEVDMLGSFKIHGTETYIPRPRLGPGGDLELPPLKGGKSSGNGTSKQRRVPQRSPASLSMLYNTPENSSLWKKSVVEEIMQNHHKFSQSFDGTLNMSDIDGFDYGLLRRGKSRSLDHLPPISRNNFAVTRSCGNFTDNDEGGRSREDRVVVPYGYPTEPSVEGYQLSQLRYQHAPASPGPANLPDGDSFASALVSAGDPLHGGGLEEDAQFCSCSQPDVGPCWECHSEDVHQSWCSKASQNNMPDLGPICRRCNKPIRPGYLESDNESNVSFTIVRNQSDFGSLLSDYRNGRRDKNGNYRSREGTFDAGYSTYGAESGQQMGGASPNSYMKHMGDIDRKLTGGFYDFHSAVSINDVDTTLRMPGDVADDVARKSDSAEEDSKAAVVPNEPMLYIDGAREAYVKALAAAQADRMPQEPWMLWGRVSKPFTTSYFRVIPRKTGHVCPDCKAPYDSHIDHTLPLKPGTEMRHIFGSVNYDDFFPGGKKNPHPEGGLAMSTRPKLKFPPISRDTNSNAKTPRKRKKVKK